MCLTERACEKLIPVMGHRMKFLKLLTKEKSSNDSRHMHTPTAITPENPANLEEQTKEPQASQNPRYVPCNSGKLVFPKMYYN